MSTNNEEDFLKPFNQFLGGLDHHNPKEKLFLLSGLVELLRHTKSATDLMYMMELLAEVQNVDWARIPFSITKTLLSEKYVSMVRQLGVPDAMISDVLQTSLLLFLDEMWAMTPEAPTEARLQEIIAITAADVAEALQPAKKEPPPANPKLPVVSPEIFNSRLVRRVFDPVAFTPALAEELRISLVNYRGTFAGDKVGPVVRGIALSVEPEYHILLETGEYVTASADYAHVAISTAPEDYKHLNPALLLALVAAADVFESFGVIDSEQAAMFRSGKLGKLSKMHFLGVCDADDLQPLEHVFDIGREAASMGVTGATGPVGASVRFPVPGKDVVVVIEAQQDASGPYSISRLCKADDRGKEVVLMRHETPRLHSVRGVYLFPLQDCLVSLTGIG